LVVVELPVALPAGAIPVIWVVVNVSGVPLLLV
jgi:hypothetical protein